MAHFKISTLPLLSLAAVTCLTLTACEAGETLPSADRPQQTSGRYWIAENGSQVIKLDTATGKSWLLVSTGPSLVDDVTAWLPIDEISLTDWAIINGPPQSSTHPETGR